MAFLTDSSSHAHALTVQGGASWSTTTRKFGAGALDLTAAAFDGGIATPDSADWHLGSNSFTIEAQVIFTGSTPSNGAAIVTQYDGTATGWWLGMKDNANLAFFWTQGGSLFSTNVAFAPVLGTAYHIAAERDASNTLRLYIDGVPKRAVILSGALFNSTAPLVIGNDSRGGFKFPGVIDEVRITKAPRYSGAFTPPIAAFADNTTVDPLFGSVVLLAHFNPLPGEDHPTAGTIAAWHFDSYNPHAGGYGSQGLYMVANEADVFLITTGDSVNDGQGAYPITFFDFYNYHIATGNLTRVAQADWAGSAFNPQKLGQDDSATGLVGTRLHSIGSLSAGATAASRVHYCLDVSTPTAPVMLTLGDTGDYAASNTSFAGAVNQGAFIGSRAYFPASGSVYDADTNLWSTMPTPPGICYRPYIVALGTSLYCLGGTTTIVNTHTGGDGLPSDAGTTYTLALWCYDTVAGTWVQKTDMPVPTGLHAITPRPNEASVNGTRYRYVKGALGHIFMLRDGITSIDVYNAATNTWSVKTNPVASVMSNFSDNFGTFSASGYGLAASNDALWFAPMFSGDLGGVAKANADLGNNYPLDEAFLNAPAINKHVLFRYMPGEDGFSLPGTGSGPVTDPGGGGTPDPGGSTPGSGGTPDAGSNVLPLLSLSADAVCDTISNGSISIIMDAQGLALAGNVADADAIELFFDAEGLGLAGTLSDGDAVLPEAAMAGSMEPALALTLLDMQGTALAGAVGDFDGALLPLDAYGGLEPALRLGRIGADGRMVAGTVAGGLLVLPALHAAGTSGTDGALLLSIWQTNGAALAGTLSHGAVKLTKCTAAGRMLAHGQADGALTLPVLQAQGAGLSIASTKAAVTLPAITLPAVAASGAALTGNTMTAQIAVPLLLLDSDGFADCIGTANVTLPVLRMAGALVIELPAPVFAGVVLHPRSDSAITHYVGGNFNSITSFAGLMLAAGPGGIVALAGNDDLGGPISALLVSGESDMKTEQFKRILCGYANYRTDGALELTLTTDAHDDYIYPLAPRQLDDLHPARVKFGRGVNGRYWQWRLANRDGCAFALDALTLDADALKRRVGG